MKPIRLGLIALLIATACTPQLPQVAAPTAISASPTPVPTGTPTLVPTVAPTRPAASTPRPTPIASPAQATTVDPDTTARHLRIFDQLWSTVNTQYVYPDFNGVDWAAAHPEYRTRIERGLSDEDFWQAMAEMIGRLNDDHSSFLTPSEAREQDSQLQGHLSYVGIGIYAAAQASTEHVVIFLVTPRSPAEAAGLRPHDAILAINGQPAINPDGRDNLDRLRGLAGTPVNLTIKSSGQAPREVSLTPARIDGTLRVTGRTLTIEPHARRIGYMLIPTLWDANIETSARAVLTNLMSGDPLDGLIIDMRINGGGISTNLLTLLGYFTSGRRGEFAGRSDVRPLVVTANPIGNSQSVPLVILVGDATESYAEVFAGVLREAGRAHLVGMKTAGNIETVYGYDFEDGSRAWIARETFVPPSRDIWEGTGLVPDISNGLRWDEFTDDDDPDIAAAIELLTRDAQPSH